MLRVGDTAGHRYPACGVGGGQTRLVIWVEDVQLPAALEIWAGDRAVRRMGADCHRTRQRML
jgi:hypothetical protein